MFGEKTKPLPSSVCTNLAPNLAWTILPKTNEGNLSMSPESRDCNENIEDIEIQEGGDSIKAIETENVQNNMTDVNRMIDIARQRGQHTIAMMLQLLGDNNRRIEGNKRKYARIHA